MQGTEFQPPCGASYENPLRGNPKLRQIATGIGAPQSRPRGGAANGANPVPIVVPCHRVIGSSGTLTGYGGGLPLKKRLLELEGCPGLAPGLLSGLFRAASVERPFRLP